MKLSKKTTELKLALIKTKDIVGFTADYLMHNLYELSYEQQRQVLYNLCANLYLAEHDLGLIINNKDEAKSYHPESFRSVQNLPLDIKNIVIEFVEKQKDNQEFAQYRSLLASLNA